MKRTSSCILGYRCDRSRQTSKLPISTSSHDSKIPCLFYHEAAILTYYRIYTYDQFSLLLSHSSFMSNCHNDIIIIFVPIIHGQFSCEKNSPNEFLFYFDSELRLLSVQTACEMNIPTELHTAMFLYDLISISILSTSIFFTIQF